MQCLHLFHISKIVITDIRNSYFGYIITIFYITNSCVIILDIQKTDTLISDI